MYVVRDESGVEELAAVPAHAHRACHRSAIAPAPASDQLEREVDHRTCMRAVVIQSRKAGETGSKTPKTVPYLWQSVASAVNGPSPEGLLLDLESWYPPLGWPAWLTRSMYGMSAQDRRLECHGLVESNARPYMCLNPANHRIASTNQHRIASTNQR